MTAIITYEYFKIKPGKIFYGYDIEIDQHSLFRTNILPGYQYYIIEITRNKDPDGFDGYFNEIKYYIAKNINNCHVLSSQKKNRREALWRHSLQTR